MPLLSCTEAPSRPPRTLSNLNTPGRVCWFSRLYRIAQFFNWKIPSTSNLQHSKEIESYRTIFLSTARVVTWWPHNP